MTELDLALRSGAKDVVKVLHDSPEATRREWSPSVLALFKKYRANYGQDVDGLSYKLLTETLTLAILGTASLTEMKKFKVFGHYHEDLALEVLSNRKPVWLQKWADWFLQEAPFRWGFIRRLEREGLLDRPTDPMYVMGFLSAPRQGALALLEADPELLREVPRLFEIEGGGEHSLAAVDKYNNPERSWTQALKTLSEAGKLDRFSLLELSLNALNRDFATFRAGWFSRFHESLGPSLEERVSLKEAYLALLHSQVEPTVSFALKALVKIAKTSELPEKELSRGLEAVWLSNKKSTAKAGLTLLKKLPPGDPRLEHLSQVVLHPHSDIVRLAFGQLQKQMPEPVSPWLSRWKDITEDLPATVRAEWSAWLGCEVPLSHEEDVAEAEIWSPSAIQPCASVEEVCQLASRLLETMEPVWDVECLLDGVLRFPKPDSPLLTALKKRARQRCHSRHITRALGAVLLTWMGDPVEVELPRGLSFKGFLYHRMTEVQELLTKRQSSSLFSLPSSELGFVEVEQIVKGAKELAERPYDLAQALLRLAPGEVSEGKTEVHKILAYAQGQTDKGRSKNFWPFGKKSELELCWSVAQEVRASREPLKWSWDVERRESTYDGKTYVHHKLRMKLAEDQTLEWEGEPGTDVAMRRWESTVFPRAKARWLLRGIDAIANNLDWWEADWADIVYLEHLSRIQGEWCELEALLGAFGLACKEKGQFGYSVDVIGQALGTGQLCPSLLGTALARVASTEMIKMNRWAKALLELGTLAPKSALCDSVECLLAEVSKGIDLGKLLPPLLELTLASDYRVEKPAARETLASIFGKGAAAKAAKRLLG